jgi:hypothetical protein
LNPKILTPLERRKVQAYLKADGDNDVHVRQLVYGARKNLPTIRADLALLDRLLETYERGKTSDKKGRG